MASMKKEKDKREEKISQFCAKGKKKSQVCFHLALNLQSSNPSL